MNNQSIYKYIIVGMIISSAYATVFSFRVLADTSLNVAPLVQRVSLVSTLTTAQVRITNTSNQTEEYSLNMSSVKQSNDSSARTLVASNMPDSTKSYIQQIRITSDNTNISSISLKAGESKLITLIFPKPVYSQDYYLIFLCTTNNISSAKYDGKINVTLNQQAGIGSILLVSPGNQANIIKQPTASFNDTNSIIYNQLPVSLLFVNPYPTYEAIDQQIRITNIFGSIIYQTTLPTKYILARSSRILQSDISLPWYAVGVDTISIENAEDRSGHANILTKNIIYLPINFIISLFGSLFLFLILYIRVRRKLIIKNNQL